MCVFVFGWWFRQFGGYFETFALCSCPSPPFTLSLYKLVLARLLRYLVICFPHFSRFHFHPPTFVRPYSRASSLSVTRTTLVPHQLAKLKPISIALLRKRVRFEHVDWLYICIYLLLGILFTYVHHVSFISHKVTTLYKAMGIVLYFPLQPVFFLGVCSLGVLWCGNITSSSRTWFEWKSCFYSPVIKDKLQID